MLAEQVSIQSAVVKAVYEAKSDGSILLVGKTAKQIRSLYPDCQLAARQIADILAKEAIVAGVPLQFSDPSE